MSNQIERWFWYPKDLHEDAMSGEEKKQAIAEFRKRQTLDPKEYTEHKVSYFLLRLGDIDTIQSAVSDVRVRGDAWNWSKSGMAAGNLRNSHQVRIIPFLADDLWDNESILTKKGVYSPFPRWSDATELIENILRYSPDVPQSVRDSIEKSPYNNTWDWRDALRVWWQENKEHFEREDYAALTPLPLLTGLPSAEERFREGLTNTSLNQPLQAAASSAATVRTALPPVADSAPATSPNSSSRPYIILLLVAALAAIVAFAFFKHRHE